jgi:hypothetical protein
MCLRVRFSEKDKQLVGARTDKYYQLNDVQCLDMFLPKKYKYKIVDESEEADICIIGIQHIDNTLLRDNEINILLNVENLSVGRTHYQHFNKFKRYNNPKIDMYIYNDISNANEKAIPTVIRRIQYFKSIENKFNETLNTPFNNKKFCLFVSRNSSNNNKIRAINILSKYGNVDFINKYDNILKDRSCYNDIELLKVFNQYKFIICFENSKTNGYITEKIFNVFLSKSIPIYDGAPDVDIFINSGSFLKYDSNMEKNIVQLLDNEELYNSVINREKTMNIPYDCDGKLLDNLLRNKHILSDFPNNN